MVHQLLNESIWRWVGDERNLRNGTVERRLLLALSQLFSKGRGPSPPPPICELSPNFPLKRSLPTPPSPLIRPSAPLPPPPTPSSAFSSTAASTPPAGFPPPFTLPQLPTLFSKFRFPSTISRWTPVLTRAAIHMSLYNQSISLLTDQSSPAPLLSVPTQSTAVSASLPVPAVIHPPLPTSPIRPSGVVPRPRFRSASFSLFLFCVSAFALS